MQFVATEDDINVEGVSQSPQVAVSRSKETADVIVIAKADFAVRHCVVRQPSTCGMCSFR
jgi:hypothetical protein